MERVKLAKGVYRLPDGRIWIRALVWPNRRRQGTLPADTPESVAVATRERWEHELRAMAGTAGSLTVRTIGEALRLYRHTPNKRGQQRRVNNEKARYNRLMEELGRAPIHEAYGALSGFIHHHRHDFAPATLNRHVTILKAAVSAAYNHRSGIGFSRAIPQNYLAGFPMQHEDSVHLRVLSPEERDKLWEVLPSSLRPLYYFACRIPVRLFEAVNLTRDQVNVFSGLITLPASTSKTQLGRTLVVMEEFKAYVEAFHSSPAKYLFNRGKKHGYAPLGYYSDKRGGIVFNRRKEWYAALEKASITDYNFHRSRQEAVLNLYQEGWSEPEIMHLGGWKSLDAFERYFNRDVALMIKQKRYDMRLDWQQRYARNLAREAA